MISLPLSKNRPCQVSPIFRKLSLFGDDAVSFSFHFPRLRGADLTFVPYLFPRPSSSSFYIAHKQRTSQGHSSISRLRRIETPPPSAVNPPLGSTRHSHKFSRPCQLSPRRLFSIAWPPNVRSMKEDIVPFSLGNGSNRRGRSL